jgi:hypothetical protein
MQPALACDFHNHLYETRDAFISYVPKRPGGAIEYGAVRGGAASRVGLDRTLTLESAVEPGTKVVRIGPARYPASRDPARSLIRNSTRCGRPRSTPLPSTRAVRIRPSLSFA